jgi:DNA-binding PadR family transcriptional regulator
MCYALSEEVRLLPREAEEYPRPEGCVVAAHAEPGRGSGRGRAALLEPAILAAIAAEPAHGYDLRRAVEEMTQGLVVLDPGGTYRVLRQLEKDGFGPQRRTYKVTKEGRELLASWRTDLDRRQHAFESVIEMIDRSLAPSESTTGLPVLNTKRRGTSNRS